MVGQGEAIENVLSFAGQVYDHLSSVFLPGRPDHQAATLHTIDEADRALVMKEELAGQRSDGADCVGGHRLYGEQRLVLARLDAFQQCGAFTEAEEAADLESKFAQLPVLRL